MDKQAAKRRREEDEDGSIISMDRISELPQPILHQILSFLSQREAIQTCVLSKSWRYLGSTRPNFEFHDRWFYPYPGKETFLSVVDKILHRYHDQKISVQNFILEMRMAYSESISFLEKWIPLVVLNMGVNTFSLSFLWYTAQFALPAVVYKAEFLKELNLRGCKLGQINPLDEVMFKHLQKLYLFYVYIADETFEKIMSSCPLIEYVNLKGCEGLKTIKVNKAHHNLKEFYFNGSSWFLKLNELFKSLSHSEISLNIPIVLPDTTYGGVCKTVVVEKLRFRGYYSYSSLPAFLSCLFRIFHPRYIGEYSYTDAQTQTELERDKQLIQFLCKILLMETETRHYLWQQDLEKASMEVFDENGKQWHPIRGTGLSEYQFYQRIRFRLKWRALEG